MAYIMIPGKYSRVIMPVMSQKVILIYPPVYDFAAFDLYNKPLGLLYVGAFLRESGYEPVLIDAMDRYHPKMLRQGLMDKARPNGTGKYYQQRIERPAQLAHIPRNYYRFGMPEDIIAELLSEYRDDPPAAVIITSMMTYWYPGVAQTIALARKILPNTPIGLGGVYARLMPEHARRVCKPDQLFETSDPADVVNWINKLTDNRTTCLSGRPFEDWPAPAYELYHQLPYLMLMTSLGCPYRCDYCSSRFLQPELQQLSPQRFIDQFKNLIPLLKPEPHYRIALADDALLVNADNHFIPILDQIAALKIPTRFYTPNGLHCRFISPQVAQRMYDNGFEMIRLSYEASDEATRWQQASDNKVNDHYFYEAMENLNQAGYQTNQLEAYVLVGMPGQTLEETAASAQAAHRAGLRVRLCQFTPIPHTPLFKTACQEYGIDPDEPLLHNNSILATLDRRVSMDEFQKFKNLIHHLNGKLMENNRL